MHKFAHGRYVYRLPNIEHRSFQCVVLNCLEGDDIDPSYLLQDLVDDGIGLTRIERESNLYSIDNNTVLQEYLKINPPVGKALEFAVLYSDTDSEGQKEWVIDQMVRALTGDNYQQLIEQACVDKNKINAAGVFANLPRSFWWSRGIPPHDYPEEEVPTKYEFEEYQSK